MQAAGVLVTGAGGPAGVAVIESLVRRGRAVVAVDASRDAVGLRLATAGAVVPKANAEDFIGSICDVASTNGAVALIPTVAEEIPALVSGAGALDEAGVAHWLPRADAVGRCLDKWLFHLCLLDASLPVPPAALGSSEDVPGPWIVKPRWGRGSRDIMRIDSPADLSTAIRLVPDPIVQTRLGGREFTVDTLVDRDGTLAGTVARWRLEVKGGISTCGMTFDDEELSALVGDVLGAVGLVGPANVQGFRDASGLLKITEVNPRFSGGLPLSLAAGGDFVGEYLRGIEGLPIRPDHLRGRPGVQMFRHFSEIFEG